MRVFPAEGAAVSDTPNAMQRTSSHRAYAAVSRPLIADVGRLETRGSRIPPLVLLEIGDRMNFTIESELEEDGRWLAEVPELPGVLSYGTTREEAMSHAHVLALRVIAERLEHGEASPQPIHMTIPA